MEALKRYRNAGEQTVRVEHVTVNEGGQAIVGNVTHRGRGGPPKCRANPMNASNPFQQSPRCSATSKRTRERCKAPAVNGWTVCRFHGARGGARKGKANAAYKHGLHTQEARAERRLLSDLLRQSRKAIAAAEGAPAGSPKSRCAPDPRRRGRGATAKMAHRV